MDKVCPDLVVKDEEGKPLTVRYDAVNAMLLNEFLKAHRTIKEQETTIAELKSGAAKQDAKVAEPESSAAKQQVTIVKQQKQIEALTWGLQKVSDAVELNRTVSQKVVASYQ